MYMFPFNKVYQHESIIIYGAGYLGKSYWSQIKALDYCRVVCFADVNFRMHLDLGVPIIPPEKITQYDFDKIVIAIVDIGLQNEIYDMLLNLGVEPSCIVCHNMFLREFSAVSKTSEAERNYAWKHHKISIAFDLSGGLGDCIIGLSWIRAILADFEADDVGVDIYSMSHARDNYLPELTAQSPYINGFFSVEDENVDYTKYDVSILLSYTMRFIYEPDFNRLKIKSTAFADLVFSMWQKAETYGLSDKGTDMYAHFARCKLKNLNCYTAVQIYGVRMEEWRIPIHVDSNVDIDLPKRYIAVNYGWGDFAIGNTTVKHCKIWPLEYYEELIALLKNRFPDFQIVQLGVKGTPKMREADLYIFNEPLNVTKYVLKHGALLIDGEGGLTHLASQLGTKCAVLFGPTPMHYFGYDYNINIVSDETNCRGCCWLWDDFRVCGMGLDKAECMYSLKPEKVLEKVSGYLGNISSS